MLFQQSHTKFLQTQSAPDVRMPMLVCIWRRRISRQSARKVYPFLLLLEWVTLWGCHRLVHHRGLPVHEVWLLPKPWWITPSASQEQTYSRSGVASHTFQLGDWVQLSHHFNCTNNLEKPTPQFCHWSQLWSLRDGFLICNPGTGLSFLPF